MKKRLLAICLALCLIVGLLPTTAMAAPVEDGDGLTAENPMSVPVGEMAIKNGTYYGIKKGWFQTVNPDKETMYFSISIPDSVTTVASDGFRDSYSSEKSRYGAVTYNDDLGRYNVVALDFSKATELTVIKSQAAAGCALSGILDLSKTKIKTLEKSAFSGCTGLTGVILPQTLEVLGTSDGGSGSVFNGCTGLEFVRTAGGSETADFELPSGLKVIGKDTFKDNFREGTELKVHIPESVEIIGSQAFYNEKFAQIYIDRQSGYDGYDSGAFKYVGLLILPNNEAYKGTGSFTRTTKTYPVTLKFMNGSDLVDTQLKLYGQSIQYTQDGNGIWYQDDAYTLPDPGSVGNTPGYDAGWKIYGDTKILTNTSKVSGWQDAELEVSVVNDVVVSKPTVEYMVNGSVVEYAGSGVPDLTVTVDQKNPGTVGVQVTHPLATEEAKKSGTYVYFKYCWWDEKDDGVNGPRSETEPDLFSTAINSSNYSRVFTDQNVIPIRNTSDTRTDGDYYLVEIYGYYVEDKGTAKQFYKSRHNFIAGDNATDRSYVMNVDVVDTTPITITPADITVYTGGEGYTGVVDDAGNMTTTANGLPEPGYYITLPDWLNDQLGGNANAEDLSDILTFAYNDGNGTIREWKLELYGTEQHSTDVAGVITPRYIYRLLPGVDENEKEIPIRLQLTDPDDPEAGAIISDAFTPNLEEQYQAYQMQIYSGTLDPGKITARLKLSGGQTAVCGVESDPGTLVVRGLTGEKITSEIVTEESKLPADSIAALAPESGVTYYVNDSNVAVADPTGVRLLVDSLIDDEEASQAMLDYIKSDSNNLNIPTTENTKIQAKYMDLVDSKNGNAYLTMGDGQKMKIYWPVPSDFDAGTTAHIVHFEALDRDYTDASDALKDNPPEQIELEAPVTVNGAQYFVFETSSFSPFVLVYEQEIINSHTYTLRYNTNGGQQIQSESKSRSWVKAYDELPVPVREGYIFKGWYLDSSLTNRVEEDVKVNRSSVTLYAKWSLDSADPDNSGVSDWLETEEHRAYLQGYGNGNFGPTDKMTRAEVAQMFYNLLKDQDVPVTVTFTDVPEDAWYRDAVQALASLGIVEGIGNGKFAPERTITRAEFTAIAMRFTNGALDGENIFSDVSEDEWFYEEVVGSIQYGWINGYTDGTFRPYNNIARSEVTAITNRMLGRSADEAFVDGHADELRQFPDVSKDVWGYYEIMEATNTHDYTKDTDGETWADLG